MENKIRKRLKLNVVKFAFKKKNGETRYATGTNNIMLLNEMYGLNLKDNSSVDRGDLINYYDLEKMGWRCFNKELLTKIY
jgi:hypothetical protein